MPVHKVDFSFIPAEHATLRNFWPGTFLEALICFKGEDKDRNMASISRHLNGNILDLFVFSWVLVYDISDAGSELYQHRSVNALEGADPKNEHEAPKNAFDQ